MKLSDFARFSVAGLHSGITQLSCDRCGEAEGFGIGTDDVALTDLIAWARDHRCPEAATTAPALEAVPA